MTPEEWNRLFDVFHAAREKSGWARVTVLDSACGENTVLRKAVEELLREDEAASGFLCEPLFSSITGEARASPIVPGQRLGRYVTVALIGRGGMGEVWSAQDTDLDRLVALKFLTSETLVGLDPQLITREVKAASALNHHGIVTIYEVVPSGPSPAIAMELIEGKPIRELCGEPLPIRSSFRLWTCRLPDRPQLTSCYAATIADISALAEWESLFRHQLYRVADRPRFFGVWSSQGSGAWAPP
jgi:hypothetical protein